MEKFLTLKNGQDIYLRSVVTDKEKILGKEDFRYCYDLAKKTAMDDVVALAGKWPKHQQELFALDFYEEDTYILLDCEKRIGCFSIHDNGHDILFKKAYIEPDYQGMGIWSKGLSMALDMAHERQKPLKMSVLISNEDMLETAQKYGFVKTGDFSMDGDASWVQMNILCHKETLKYGHQADIVLSYE